MIDSEVLKCPIKVSGCKTNIYLQRRLKHMPAAIQEGRHVVLSSDVTGPSRARAVGHVTEGRQNAGTLDLAIMRRNFLTRDEKLSELDDRGDCYKQ